MLICLACALKGHVVVLIAYSDTVSLQTMCERCGRQGHYCDNELHPYGIWPS